MASFFLKLFGFEGISPLVMPDLLLGSFVVLCLTVMAAIVVDGLDERISFGVAGNTLTMLGAMLGGLIVYAQFIQPLRHTPPLSILVIAVASAVTGFIALSYVKMSAQQS
jgi:hypothetical protein